MYITPMLTPIFILLSVLFSLHGEFQILLDRCARMIGGWYPGMVTKKYTLQIVFERVLSVTKPGHMIIRGLTSSDIQSIKDNFFDTSCINFQ